MNRLGLYSSQVTRHLIHYFLSWPGLFALAALDASVIFTLPVALDIVVIAMSSTRPHTFWLCPIVATAGSLTGITTSMMVGAAIGARGLNRFVPEKYMTRITERVKRGSVLGLALVPLMPPPFPFTAVVIAAGALKAGYARVLGSVSIGLFVRFTLETCLALIYGRRIVRWINSDIARDFAIAMIALAIAASAYSIWRLVVAQRSAAA